jgi:hypothetical protein
MPRRRPDLDRAEATERIADGARVVDGFSQLLIRRQIGVAVVPDHQRQPLFGMTGRNAEADQHYGASEKLPQGAWWAPRPGILWRTHVGTPRNQPEVPEIAFCRNRPPNFGDMPRRRPSRGTGNSRSSKGHPFSFLVHFPLTLASRFGTGRMSRIRQSSPSLLSPWTLSRVAHYLAIAVRQRFLDRCAR